MDTLGFLQALYKDLLNGALSVTAKVDGRMCTRWFESSQLEEMARFIGKCGRKYNTYIGINPRNKPLGEYSRGQKEDIASLIAFYADCDVKGPAHNCNG